MIETTDYEVAQILLELAIPRYGFSLTWGCKKKRSAIAVAVVTSSESPLLSMQKATEIATSTIYLSFSSDTDHSDPDYNPTRKRTGAKKISLKREKKKANYYLDLKKNSNLKLKEKKQEMNVLLQINDGEGADGQTGLPDLNIPLAEPTVGFDVNVTMTNKNLHSSCLEEQDSDLQFQKSRPK